MKNNLLFSQATAIGKRLVMVLTMLLVVGVGSVWGATETATNNCGSAVPGEASDLESGKLIQWKVSSTNTYNNPIRVYANTTITISAKTGVKRITKVEITASSTGNYVTYTKDATWTASGTGTCSVGTKSVSDKVITVPMNGDVTTVTIKPSSQTRWSKVVVTYETTAAAQTYDVTLSRNGVTETINDVEDGTALDDIDGTGDQGGCSPEWVFEGWSKTQRSAQNNTAVMDLVTTVDGAGPYYAVYSHTAEGGGGSSTATMSSFSAISGYVNDDANVSYEAAKGNASTAPGVYSNIIRIYQNGGTLTITGNNEKKLTSITIGSSMATSVSYKIDGGTESSNQSIAANDKFTLSDIEASSVVFTCKGTSSSSRLYLNYLSVTYSGGSTVYYTTSPECTIETTVSTYTVKHCKEGLEAGTYPDDLIETETLEGTIGDQVTPERKNYTGFTAPAGKQVTIQEDGSLIVTYQYTRKSYTLEWVLGEGQVTTEGTAAPLNSTGTISQSVRYETPITAPIVARTGYRFNKWDSSVSNKMPATNKSFTATWVKTWDITWKAQGNTIQKVTVDDGSYLTLPTEEITTCEGMTHIGWTATENYISDTDAPNDFFTYAIGTVTEANTYYAIYAINCGYTKLDWGSEVPEGKYLISTGEKTIYGLNGSATSYLGATTYTPTTDLKPEYEVYIRNVAGGAFAIQLPNTMWVGWKSSTDTKLISDSPENDASSTWKYTEKGIQNQYDNSRYLQINGAGSEGRVYTTSGSGSTWLPTYLYARNGGGYYTACQTSVAINYDLNGGTGNMSNTRVKSGSDYIIPSAVPMQVGKTFTYWSDGTNKYNAGTTLNNLTSDIILTAQWEVAQHTVTLDPNYPEGKTGTFTNLESTSVEKIIVSYPYGTISKTLEKLYTILELEGYEFGGWYNAKGATLGTVSGSKCVETGTIDRDKNFYAKWSKLHTVTFNTGTNNPTVAAMEGTSETGITLPAGPTPACSADDWTFAGWAEASVENTTTVPTLLSQGNNYKPTEDCTLYAVYSKEGTEEGGGTTPIVATLSFADKAQRTNYSTDKQVWEQNGITLTNNKASSTTDVGDYANPARFYAKSQIIISAPGAITQIVADCDESKYATALVNSAAANASASGTTATITPTTQSETYEITLTGQTRFDSITVTYLAESGPTPTTTYNSNPTCDICENILTINKGAETNGTFTLDKIGEQETCDGLSVLVTPTPAEHYHVASVTASTSETAVNNGDGTYTITYAANSTGESTINVTFEEDAKASITLSELGEPTTDNTTYYVGETYTLPSTSSQSCDGKQLVGWSRVEVAETDTKPTEKYYERGAKVTLEAEQTFYAVFATSEEGGGDDTDYSNVHTSNVALGNTGGTNATDSKVNIGGMDYTAVKAGTGSAMGAVNITVPSGTTKLSFHMAGWNGEGNKTISLSGATADPSSFKTVADAGVSGNSTTYTLSGTIADYFYSTTLSNINTETTLTFSNGGADQRFVIWGVNASTGGGVSYTAYTTSCVPTYSITYDFAGGTGSHCSNTSVPQGDTYTICDEAPTKEGHTFQGWSDGTSTYDAGATITPSSDVTLTAVWKANTYTVTWNNNGDTDEVTYNHGESLVVPTDIASCDGVKEFVGWTEQSGYYHATTAPDDIFTTKTTPVTATATYYAVFATPPTTGGGGSIETTDDVLTRETTGVTSESTNYVSWSGKTAESSAVYAGNSAGGNDAIQLRSNNSNSGIVTTTSGGKITHVEVEWQSATADDRKLDIYGRNVAYSAATDLYSTGTQGTKLGSITYGTSTELEITGDYEYIGLRSNSGAMYLASVTITWSAAGGSSSYTDYTTTCQEVTGIAISGSYPTTFVQYDSFSFAGGIVTATFENGTTQDVTSLATFSGYNMDEVGVQTVTVTYMGQTAKYEITINQSDRWRLTWNVSGKTNTGAGPIYVQKGSAIGTLPTPVVPDACEGKTFMGWTTSNIVNSDGTGITYITSETVPTDNTTYYAVFATVNNFSVQKPINDITDGSKVVIVAVASLDNTGSTGKAISSRTISITSKGVIGLAGDDVAIFDETINTPHSTCIWTLRKNGETVTFEQGDKYIKATDSGYRKLVLDATADYWTLIPVAGKDKTYHMQSGNTNHFVEWFDHTDSKYDEDERYIGFVPYTEANDNGDFDMQFFVTANANGEADITDYTTGCTEYTITYYGFRGGYSTSTSSDGIIVLPVNSMHTIPNCEGLVINDHTNLGRTFTGVWKTQPDGGKEFKPGDTFILTQDTAFYAQWKLETTGDITLPTDVEDLAGTDIYVYGGKTLTLQPGTTNIHSLTLKGGIQSDGSYQMPNVWIPDGATLIRKKEILNLDLTVNAKNYYPFAVPFRTKNASSGNNEIDYLDPVLRAASTYGTHFVIKTYDGARRAENGEDRDNNWVKVNRDKYLEAGVGYIITALTYPNKDTATIRIPMTVKNSWFENGEQTTVGSTTRNTITATAHTGTAASGHPRHAGWNFIASPYLSKFAGNNVANNGTYINGELLLNGGFEYGGEDVPYVTIPAYDFSYYEQYKLSEVTLSPEWSFFVQIATDGTIDFAKEGRQPAPAGLAARAAEERPVKMDVDITLTDGNHSDQTGIIINDRYSDAYEIGRDLEKMFGSAYNLVVYSLMSDNTPLAYQALAELNHMQTIPIGYRAPQAGEYTFSLNQSTSSIDLLNEQYDQLILVDYETGALTNLLNSSYTFDSERTQSTSRFALYAIPRQNTPTDVPNFDSGDNNSTRKILHNGHLYIIRDGKVYNGHGQIVKH